jgi:hypothetical protein
MTQRDEVNISVIKSRFDNTKAPKDVYDKLTDIAKVVNSTPEQLEYKLRQMIHDPEYIPFHTTDDRYRAALPFLIDDYKFKIKDFANKTIEFFVIDKGVVKNIEKFRNVYVDNPADLEKLKERQYKNEERIKAGKAPREYKPIKIRQIPTGEKERITVITVSVFGIFNKYGLFQKEEIGKVFGDKFKTNFAEIILEDDDCRIIQDIQCGKTYKLNYCQIYFENNHYKLMFDKLNEPVTKFVLLDKNYPSIKTMVCKLSTPLDITKITEKDVGKYKVIHGIVGKCRTSVNKRDEMQGHLTLTSPDNKASFNTVWWNNPYFVVKNNPGAEVYIVCDIQSNEKYGISGVGHFVILLSDKKSIETSVKEVSINDWL